MPEGIARNAVPQGGDFLCGWVFCEDKVREDVVVYAPPERLPRSLPRPTVTSVGWNGDRGYRYSSSRAAHLDVHRDPDKLMFSSYVEPFLRLDTPAANNLPLSWYLPQEGVFAERRDSIDGVECWVVRRESHLGANAIVSRWWLAVDRDYLVMRYERGRLRPDGTVTLTELETASGLAQFDTGTGTDSMWFATERQHVTNVHIGADAGVPTYIVRTRFRVLSLQLNPGVDDTVFAPEPDPGMEVWGP